MWLIMVRDGSAEDLFNGIYELLLSMELIEVTLLI